MSQQPVGLSRFVVGADRVVCPYGIWQESQDVMQEFKASRKFL